MGANSKDLSVTSAQQPMTAVALLSIVLSLASPVFAETPAPSERCSQLDVQLETPGACSQLGQQLSEFLEGFAGFGFSGTVLVASDKQILLHEAYGLADLDSERPNSVGTRFPLLSLTKPLVATGLLLLAENGDLDLDSPLSAYLGDFPDEKAAATPHQLLIHTAGLVKKGHSTRSPDIDEFIANVKAAPIDSPPGEEWRYSNAGYSFATALMEVVAGKPWDAYLSDRVFSGSEMTNATVLRGQFPEDVASGHRGIGPQRRTMNFVDAPPYVSELWWGAAGATGVVSSNADVYRWLIAIANDRLLSPQSRQRMFTAYLSDQGYGWHIDEIEGHRRYWKGGGAPMYEYQVAWYPDDGFYVVIAMNDHVGWRVPVWTAIESLLIGSEPAPLPDVLGPAGAAMKELAGTYLADGEEKIRLQFDGESLLYEPDQVAEGSRLPQRPFVFFRTAEGLAGVDVQPSRAQTPLIRLETEAEGLALILSDGSSVELTPEPGMNPAPVP